MPLLDKAQIRQRINEKRALVSDAERNHAAQSATDLLVNSPLFTLHSRIACYLARREEFDSSPIIHAIWNANKHCYLPVLTQVPHTSPHAKEGLLGDNDDCQMVFGEYHMNTELALNRYRILEPQETPHLQANNLDVVILPLVSFDKTGTRLGMGGGYYDRTFAFINESNAKKPLLLGLAYRFQCVKELPSDRWDVPLHGVITEKEIVMF